MNYWLTVHVFYRRFCILLDLELDETETSVSVRHVILRQVDLRSAQMEATTSAV